MPMTEAERTLVLEAARKSFEEKDVYALQDLLPEDLEFKFYDLFAGPGGFRLTDILAADWYEIRAMTLLLFAEVD